MPVHFTVAEHGANPVHDVRISPGSLPSAKQLLERTWGNNARTIRSKELLQTSLVDVDFSLIHAMNNGFVGTVQMAYNQHHHLVIRPDDVWIAILGQFNFYVNAHAEELRHQFVAHEGQKKLVVHAAGTRYTVDFGDLAHQMTGLIHENVVDKDLKDWILPNFTTTSNNDTVVCAVLMMATLKAYFSYGCYLMCGIPSVTLEGEKEDWEKLLARIDKLDEFGAEPTAWAGLLRPILKRFVKAFDGEPDIDFWGRVCHVHSGGSGPSYLSGWLTAFFVWDSQGKWLGPSLPKPALTLESMGGTIAALVLDGAVYPIVDTDKIPTGFCEVDVELNDNGEIFDSMMVSGHLATKVDGKLKDTVRPLPSWFMFVKEECEDQEQVQLRNFMAAMDAERGK